MIKRTVTFEIALPDYMEGRRVTDVDILALLNFELGFDCVLPSTALSGTSLDDHVVPGSLHIEGGETVEYCHNCKHPVELHSAEGICAWGPLCGCRHICQPEMLPM